jgi:hypothetical protein
MGVTDRFFNVEVAESAERKTAVLCLLRVLSAFCV